MLESVTIFTQGGLILYQYTANPSLFQQQVLVDDNTTNNKGSEALTNAALNQTLIQTILLDPTYTNKKYHITEGMTISWCVRKEYVVAAIYPDILFEGPRQFLKQWAETLVETTAREYDLYYTAWQQQQQQASKEPPQVRPDPEPFDKTFRVLLISSKTQKPDVTTSAAAAAAASSSSSSSSSTTTANSSNKASKVGGGKDTTTSNQKQQRHWGNAKVTDKAMKELDMSCETAGNAEDGHARALQEARQAYLPTASEIVQEQQDDTDGDASSSSSSSWSSTVTGLFQQVLGNKTLTNADLDAPLEQFADLLQQKNVAPTIADDLCQAVRTQLVGRKLNSLYRVQTAVSQALEQTLTAILSRNPVDLLTCVARNKQSSSASFFSSSSSSSQRRPYVITVMGINGIGKTTTLAKLAYYFSTNNYKVLLVAGDTFRSGAVEQLRVHAECLNVDLFEQGYSKDPSAVTKAAIAHATSESYDVVLVDTAGRMQNNVPLMKALNKLVVENQPDFKILVCEALVGNDGLSQYEMFKQASPIDGLILTKFDTVDTKTGACLTLTHQTGSPIVFIGVGQKYHQLKKLNVSTVIKSLLS